MSFMLIIFALHQSHIYDTYKKIINRFFKFTYRLTLNYATHLNEEKEGPDRKAFRNQLIVPPPRTMGELCTIEKINNN